MADPVVEACEACFDAFKADCSGFVKAVGDRLGVTITGTANDIVGVLRGDAGGWIPVADGVSAAARAAAGVLVLAGLRGDQQANHSNHGHVVVVVRGPLGHGAYPSAYWGSLGGMPGKFETINWAWTAQDRDRVYYAEHALALG